MPPPELPVLEKPAEGIPSSILHSAPTTTGPISPPKPLPSSRIALLLMEELLEELFLDQAHAVHRAYHLRRMPCPTCLQRDCQQHVTGPSPNPPSPSSSSSASSSSASSSSSSTTAAATAAANQPIACLNCDRSVASPRWAAHLEKCLGLSSGRVGSSRAGVRRAASQIQRDSSAGTLDRFARAHSSSRSPSLGPSHRSLKRIRHADEDSSGDYSDFSDSEG
ncbi:MAG: hypothetical protein DHS80DRAFT_32650 [Piptocephalis tieghemiana]|nr:MAG: hypothetical protein DHS80DRAFT_32650 [Piptocephalis tieghemiana]